MQAFQHQRLAVAQTLSKHSIKAFARRRMLSARATTLWRRMQPHLGTQPRTPAHTPLAKPARLRRRELRASSCQFEMQGPPKERQQHNSGAPHSGAGFQVMLSEERRICKARRQAAESSGPAHRQAANTKCASSCGVPRTQSPSAAYWAGSGAAQRARTAQAAVQGAAGRECARERKVRERKRKRARACDSAAAIVDLPVHTLPQTSTMSGARLTWNAASMR